MKNDLIWTFKSFHEFGPEELYQILRLRSEVFVVEQNCAYLDMDNKDQQSFHLCGWDGNIPVAYARLLPPGLAFEEASIGRVVSNPIYRKKGMGKELMKLAMEKTMSQFGVNTIRIGAQRYLLAFYNALGFKISGPEYMEDGIPHVEMSYTK